MFFCWHANLPCSTQMSLAGFTSLQAALACTHTKLHSSIRCADRDRQLRLIVAAAMFSLPPSSARESRGGPAGSSGSGSRRSPTRSRTPLRTEDVGADARTFQRPPQQPWSTGNKQADEWIIKQGIATDVLQKLSEPPQHERMKIVMGTIAKRPENPDAWIVACVRNWRNTETANQLLGMASVQRSDRSRPVVRDRSPSRYPEAGTFIPTAVGSDVFSRGDVREGRTSPAEETITMKEHWPHNKSMLISTLMGILDEEVMERFLSLEPEDQCALCFSYMVNAAQDDTQQSKNTLMKTWLDRLDQLNGPGRRATSVISSQISCDNKFYVQIIMAGMPSIMAGTVVSVMTQVTPTLHRDMSVEFFPSIYIDINKDNKISIDAVADAFGQSFKAGIHTMQDLANEFQTLMEEWSKVNTKFIFVCNVGIAPTPDEKVAELESNRLHRSDTEWIWAFCQAAHVVRERTKDSDVAEIFFGPQAPAFHDQISSLWGEVTTSCAAKHSKVPVAMPQVFSTPSGYTVLSVVDNEALTMEPMETWGVPDFRNWMERYPGCAVAPSMVAKLLVMKLFKERPLKKPEEDMLKAVLEKDSNGTYISMSRKRFMTLYGYEGTPAQKLVEAKLPCSRLVFPTTGDAAQRPSRLTASCGQQRYCRNCEALFGMVDKSYPTYVVCDVLLALFTKVAPTWSGRQPVETAMWTRKSNVGRDHKCGPECSGSL